MNESGSSDLKQQEDEGKKTTGRSDEHANSCSFNRIFVKKKS